LRIRRQWSLVMIALRTEVGTLSFDLLCLAIEIYLVDQTNLLLSVAGHLGLRRGEILVMALHLHERIQMLG